MIGCGFTRADWDRLATLFKGVAREDANGGLYIPLGSSTPYSGYKPATVEAPNGDAYGADPCRACDGSGRVQGKRYLHVKDACEDAPDWARAYHDRAYAHACRVATALGVPAAYFPRPEFGALRVLEYPAGAGSAEHTDFDLFSVVCWRETPEDLKIIERGSHANQRLQPRANERSASDQQGRKHGNRVSRGTADAALEPDASPSAGRRRSERGDDLASEIGAPTRGVSANVGTHGAPGAGSSTIDRARLIATGLHIGELGELVGLGPATPHRVPARPYVQRSIVYFAIPDHAARLPCTSCFSAGPLAAHKAIGCAGEACGFGLTVGEWLSERMARSRYEAGR